MKLALGAAQFGLNYGIANTSGRIDEEEAQKIISEASNSGFDTIDTAISYGDSEAVLGKLGVKNWKIVTKIPQVDPNENDISGYVEREINSSLQRLGIDQLYGVLLHRPGQLLEDAGDKLYRALSNLKKIGYVKKVGVSIYVPSELDLLYEKYEFDLLQTPLNIIDRRIVDSGWANQLKRANVEIHTRSTFLQGLLLLNGAERPAKFKRWGHVWSEWEHWLQLQGITPLQGCLRYVNSIEDIDRVVVGVDTVAQLRDIIAASEGALSNLPVFSSIQDDRLKNPATWNQL